MQTVEAKWANGVASEVDFWQQWIAQKGGRWTEDFIKRLDPQRKFSPNLESFLSFPNGQRLEVLDVGSGPITSLGYVSERYEIQITATDALADSYFKLLNDAGVIPPVRTVTCKAEELTTYFGSKRFHVCHSRNALDHCIDPRSAIINMCSLLISGGILFIEVYEEEGERGNYQGLHNWNFAEEDGNFILWRSQERYDITKDTGIFGRSKLFTKGSPASGHGRTLIFVLTRSEQRD